MNYVNFVLLVVVLILVVVCCVTRENFYDKRWRRERDGRTYIGERRNTSDTSDTSDTWHPHGPGDPIQWGRVAKDQELGDGHNNDTWGFHEQHPQLKHRKIGGDDYYPIMVFDTPWHGRRYWDCTTRFGMIEQEWEKLKLESPEVVEFLTRTSAPKTHFEGGEKPPIRLPNNTEFKKGLVIRKQTRTHPNPHKAWVTLSGKEDEMFKESQWWWRWDNLRRGVYYYLKKENPHKTNCGFVNNQEQAPTTQAPTTQAPTTPAPTTQAPTTQAPINNDYLPDQINNDYLPDPINNDYLPTAISGIIELP